MKLDSMIIRFLYVWAAYWLTFLIQPVQSNFRNVQAAWLLQLLFVLVVAISFSLAYRIKAPGRSMLAEMLQVHDASCARSAIRLGYITSLVGLTLLLFDKISVQGIDYSSGIAFAREQWRTLGEERDGGTSSLFSVVGYVLGSGYFLSLALTVSKRVGLPDAVRLRFLLIGLLLLLGNSLITGGRSGVLLATAFMSYAYFTKGAFHRPALFRGRKYRMALLAAISVGISYVLYVFGARAQASELNIGLYSVEFLNFLGLDAYGWFAQFAEDHSVGQVLALLNLAVAYLTHSFATTAAIVDAGEPRGTVVFGYLFALLAKAGIVAPGGDEWFLAGRFSSLPGGLYYQFGFFGFLFMSALLGIAGGWIRGSHMWRQASIGNMFLCCVIESILLISPLTFAGELLFFPFMLLGGALCLAVVGMYKGKLFI